MKQDFVQAQYPALAKPIEQKRVQRHERARFYQGRVTSPGYPTTHLPITLCTLIHLA
jgi:hypothetical protein